MPPEPYILLDDQVSGSIRYYTDPIDIIRVTTPDALDEAFTKLAAYQRESYYLAGYIAYEAGLWMEPKLRPLISTQLQTWLEFGVFGQIDTVPIGFFDNCRWEPQIHLTPSWSEAEYVSRFQRVQDYIRAGDVYQINLTFPMSGYYAGTARAVYDCLRKRQPGAFGGIISLSDQQIVSFSPELFFKIDGAQINMRPMKGTARRLPDPDEDKALAKALQLDVKNRAENLMIVDLLRNDLSRIAKTGSVSVPKLFALETYPTLHQMTSQVRAELRDDVDIKTQFKALFPCGSVTGAPKIRAMEIIHELETGPRGPYCGAIGYIDPDGDSCFNVAIRTLSLKDNIVTYNVGSGVVLDSDGADEYAECLLKSKILETSTSVQSEPDLIETFRWTADRGIIRRERHVARLIRSAQALGYPLDRDDLDAKLDTLKNDSDLRVRLTLSADGVIDLQTQTFTPLSKPVKLCISRHALTADVQETRYKVSDRMFYDGERRRISAKHQCDEVVFTNDRGELCEGSFTSLFVQIGDMLFTPLLSNGLLPGVLREELIATGQAIEKILSVEDLINANKIYVGNSLRGLMLAELISPIPQ